MRVSLTEGLEYMPLDGRLGSAAMEGSSNASGATPEGESAGISDLSQRIGNILRRVNKSLHPDSLPQIDRAEMQEYSAALEQMKMLISELEIFRLGLN